MKSYKYRPRKRDRHCTTVIDSYSGESVETKRRGKENIGTLMTRENASFARRGERMEATPSGRKVKFSEGRTLRLSLYIYIYIYIYMEREKWVVRSSAYRSQLVAWKRCLFLFFLSFFSSPPLRPNYV